MPTISADGTMHLTRLLILATLLVSTLFAGVTLAQPAKRATLGVHASVDGIQPGQPFDVAVRWQIQPGWHMYWRNPGDAGMPPNMKLVLPPGFTAGEFRYPVPHKIDDSTGALTYGYEGELVLIATVTPPTELPGDSVTITASGDWLVCERVCLAERGSASIALPVRTDPAKPAETDRWKGWHAALPLSLQEAQDQKLITRLDAGRDGLSIQLPPGADKLEIFNDEAVAPSEAAVVQQSGESRSVLFRAATGGEPLRHVLAFDFDGRHVGIDVPIEPAGTSENAQSSATTPPASR